MDMFLNLAARLPVANKLKPTILESHEQLMLHLDPLLQWLQSYSLLAKERVPLESQSRRKTFVWIFYHLNEPNWPFLHL